MLVLVAVPVPPSWWSLRFAGVGPKVREYEEASAVSDGLEGNKEGNADVMRVGDMSSGFGGLMNKPWVESLGEGDECGCAVGSTVSCGGGLEDMGVGRVGRIKGAFGGSGFEVLGQVG